MKRRKEFSAEATYKNIVRWIEHRLSVEPTPITVHIYPRHDRRTIAGRLNKDLKTRFHSKSVNFETI